MDITVSIADHKSLSTSDLIRQKLYSSVQIGNTCHAGSGLLIRGAKFRSGTVENPLILTVKNSQTETVMYVRNVPISAVLEKNGFCEQWVAVYPPGDPQNYQHFDPATPPPHSCPQVCISIAVQEEEDSAGVSSHLAFDPQPRLSTGQPQPRLSTGPWAAPEGQRPSWAPPSVLPPTSAATSADVAAAAPPASNVSLDGSFRLKAQRLKEHVAEVANAAKRAQDVTRTLQESLRIRDDLRHQLRGLEEELASQHSATSGLQREIGQLHAEEAQLKEQISQRNSVFQELRESRQSIDRELSRVLGEGDRQRSQIEASSKDFVQQRQNMAGEIEHSKLHVNELMATLKQREEVVAESQRKAREALQAAISKARADLAGARASLDEQQKACGRLDCRRSEAMAQLELLQGGTMAQEGSPEKGQADARADLDSRRGKIDAQQARARSLEQELNGNRSELERMSARVAELHTEAREKELIVQRCEDARLELERQLAERRSSGASFQEQVRASGGHLARADQEAERAREALDMAEQVHKQAHENQPPENVELELAIRGRREQVASLQSELAAMRGACEGLEATTRSSRLLVSDRKSALEAARGRASELARRLAEAAAASTTDSSDALRRLAQDIAGCNARLLEAQRHTEQREQEVQQLLHLQREAAREAGEGEAGGSSRAASLEAVAAELRREVECLEEAKSLAKMQHLEMEGDLAANQLSLTDLQTEIDNLMAESQSSEDDLAKMVRDNEAFSSRLSAGYDKLAELEEVSCVQKAELDQSRTTLQAKLQKIKEMQETHRREIEELTRREASLTSERAEAERAGSQLQAQLSELESECSQLDGAVATHRRRQQELQSTLEETMATEASANATRKDQMSQTMARVGEAASAVRSSMERRERALSQLQTTETARKVARSRLTTVREEAEDEVGKAALARSHLDGRHESLVSLHSELEESQSQASQMERLRAKLVLENEEYMVRIEPARLATQEVQRLEQRLLELQEQRRAEELRQRDQEREVREQLQRRDADALQRREAEIDRHQEQIGELEAEQRELHQQAGRLEAERRALEQGLAERGRERQDAQEAYLCEAHTCELLETTAQETRSLAQRLEQREVLRRTVVELEESLQRLGDDLEEVQELVRRERTEEEELRLDIQKLKESITSTDDKALYQGEHGNLQFETIQKLEEQKKKCEQELELLTLGLHDAEQRNEFLETQNRSMQQQVEGLYSGSMQDWAVEVRRAKGSGELARGKEEIESWKHRAEKARKDRQRELGASQRQHEARERQLRDRVTALRGELERTEQAARRREATLVRRQERGEAAPAGPMPGLVVPQRPLPSRAARRRALLVGANYSTSHAPLKGCVNDVWNLQCLLRYTLQYSEDQLQVLLDSADGRPTKPKRAPTKANILQGLQWLMTGAQPGDSLLFVFCGYGAQHPRSLGADEHEAYLVPSDFAADLPADFFAKATSSTPLRRNSAGDAGTGYRLLSILELQEMVSRLPASCRMSMMLDCCYSVLPRVSPASNFPPTFPKVDWGEVNYDKFRDFISRPRFLELPVLPVQHTPAHLRAGSFPSCSLHCFSGCRREEWCAEFPIEGTVQGAFSWAFLKALAKAHFHCGVYQFQQVLASVFSDLRTHFKAVEQTPLVQLSQKAGMQDVVLWT